MAKTYIQEKLKGEPGQIVSFKQVSSSPVKYEAIVKDAPVNTSKSIILNVVAPDADSRVIVTNTLTNLESDPRSVAYVPNETDGLVTSNGNEFYVSSGNVHTFSLPTLGEWVVIATKGGLSVKTSINIQAVGTYEVSLSYFNAYIDVVYPIGATCTCSDGIDTFIASDTDGSYRFCVNKTGNWIVQAYTTGVGQAIDVVSISDPEEIVVVNLSFVDSVLNNNSWSVIQAITMQGIASNYWSIGDCKGITLNGTVGSRTFSNETFYAEIVGFDHNTAIESNAKATITFQIGKKNVTDFTRGNNNGTEVGFYYASGFYMNSTNTSVNGWQNSYMRTTLMPSIKNALPTELKNILMSVKKYTDNGSGSTHNASDVTGTYENLFLPSEYEVFNTITNANTNESVYQEQYIYYATASKIRYRDSATTTANAWWLRSPRGTSNANFCCVNTSGETASTTASTSNLIAPMFVIGG